MKNVYIYIFYYKVEILLSKFMGFFLLTEVEMEVFVRVGKWEKENYGD